MLGHVAFSRFLLMSCPFTCPCLSFNSDLGQLLICPQAELHAFQMIIDIKCQYLSIPMLQFQEPSSHVNVVSIRSQLCRDVCVYNFYFYSPCYMYLQRDICVGLQRKVSWNFFVLLFRCFHAYLSSLYRLWASLVGTGITLVGEGCDEVSLS